jgi:flotillin
LLIEKLPELVKHAREAVKISKLIKSPYGIQVTMATTEQILNGMKTVPPLNDLFNMAGLNLPTYLKGEDKVEK